MTFEYSVGDFMTNYGSPILIWGAGNAGDWLGYYFDKTGIQFEAFIDKLSDGNCFKNYKTIGEKRILSITQLLEKRDKEIRIIIANREADSVMRELHKYETKFHMPWVVLYPFCEDVTHKNTMVYNINEVLAYFRNRLIDYKVPSIISNTCIAGFYYRMIGYDKQIMSPTISQVIRAEEYLKIAKKPYKYLKKNMESSGWTIYKGKKIPTGCIDDVNVLFLHDTSLEQPVERWNNLMDQIDFDNLFFIFDEHMYKIPEKVRRDFLDIENRKILILRDNICMDYAGRKDVMYIDNDNIHIRGEAIENYLDIMDLAR